MAEKIATTTPKSGGRIIDRKISPAGPSLFASNLGATRTPKTPASANVRAIVDWLESSGPKDTPGGSSVSPPDSSTAETETPLQQQQHHRCRGQSPSIRSGRGAAPSTRSQAAVPSPAAATEDYSLTLLKFKSYFNNRPLGRCLDGGIAEDVLPEEFQRSKKGETERKHVIETGASSKSPVVEASTSQQPAPQEHHAPSHDQAHKKATSLQKLSSLMDVLSFLPTSTSPSPPPSPPPIELNPPTRPPPRPPSEITSYWASIRAYLSISDSELGTVSRSASLTSSIRSATSSSSSHPPSPAIFPPLSTSLLHRLDAALHEQQQGCASERRRRRRARTTSNTPRAGQRVVGSTPPGGHSASASLGWRRRRGHRAGEASREEKMSEIDEFLDERSPTVGVLNGGGDGEVGVWEEGV